MTTEFDWTELRTAEDYPNIRGMRQALEDLGPISDAEREYAEEYINGWIFEYEADDPFCKPERFTVNFLVQIDADGSSRLLCQLQYGQAYRIFTAREYFEKYLIYDEDYLWQSGYDVVMREMRDYAERIRKDTSLQLGGNGLAYGYVYKLDAQKHRVTEFRFEGDDADHRTNLILSEDCAFWINYEVGNLHYKKVDLDTFIQAVGDVDSRYGSGRECEVSLVNGKAVGLRLMNYYPEISLYERIPDTYYHENREEGNFKEEAVYRENVLNWTGDEDNKRETIRVYTGNMGDGQSGYITIENKEGDVFYADGDNTARAGWHNIYLGELEGRLYFYQLYDETQGDHGSMAYHAYTVDGYGHVSTISGARFDFSRDSFNEDAFNLWADKMNYYLKDTHLLLGIRDGEVSTRPVSDYDLYEKSALLKRIMQEE